MDLRASLATIRRSWPLLVVPVIAGLVLAVVALAVQTPKYLSTANVYVSVGNASNANDLSQANSFAQSAAANFAALAEQPYVLHAVRTELDLPLTSEQIAQEMSTSVAQSTSIISIDVLDPSPSRSAQIANATARQLSTAVSVLNPSANDGTQAVKVTVVRTASVAQSPSVPNRPMGIALGLLAGLLLGVVLVILRELLDTRIRHTTDLQRITGAPVVGQIPRTSSVADRPLVLVDDAASAAAEGFRLLQLNTEYLRAPGDVVTIGIASAMPSEGKSTVAANLALALSAAGHRVALVDADLRRPRLHAMFGLDNSLGLTEVLVGRADVDDVVQAWGTAEGGIAVVPAGATPPNPGELLQSPRLRAALERLAEEADVVVVDGPPLLAVADSAVLARTVDAVLLVASLQRSHRAPVLRAVGALDGVGAQVLGAVATMTRPTRADSDAYLRYTDGAPADRLPVDAAVKRAEAVEQAKDAARRLVGRTRNAVADRRRRMREPADDGVPADAPQPLSAEDERNAAADARAGDVAPDAIEPAERVEAAESERTATEDAIDERDAAPLSDADDESEAPGRASVDLDVEPTDRSRIVEREPEVRSLRGARPARLPAASDSDARTLRAAKRRMSEDELRVLRSFSAARDSRFER